MIDIDDDVFIFDVDVRMYLKTQDVTHIIYVDLTPSYA